MSMSTVHATNGHEQDTAGAPRKADRDAEGAKERERELFEEIGRLKMELEWMKKKAAALG